MTASSRATQRALVIGSQGFIGQHVVRELASVSNAYLIFTADIVEGQSSLPHWRIDGGDSEFEKLLGWEKFDLCINCSGAASVAESTQNPLRDYELNAANVARILDAIRKTRGADCRFLNLSSAAVYGNPRKLPVTEKAEAKPISPYGLHKLQAEQLVHGYAQLFGLQTSSVRIFSAYGTPLKKQLFWDLYCKARASDTLELWGTGDETRDFIEVSDLARAIRIVCEQAPFLGESVNVASGTETSIREAADIFVRHLDPTLGVAFNGKVKEGDPRNWCADITLLRSLGFEPTVSMEQGLQAYVNWLRTLPK